MAHVSVRRCCIETKHRAPRRTGLLVPIWGSGDLVIMERKMEATIP